MINFILQPTQLIMQQLSLSTHNIWDSPMYFTQRLYVELTWDYMIVYTCVLWVAYGYTHKILNLLILQIFMK